ncbi:MAG: hypothetical protein M3P18_11795 [Actinomycetota bacterium]|nr:hypothetical protein [Actinomycetota bacterium]
MEFVRTAGFHPSRKVFVVPRPLRSGVPFVSLGALALVGGLTGVTPLLSSELVGAAFALFGVVRASVTQHELTRLRREADRQLRRAPAVTSPVTAWRVAELTSDRRRAALARTVTKMERDLSPTRLAGVSPLNRVAARPHSDLLAQLADRLSAFDRPVTPLGVLQVDDLLTEPESPLYARERAAELRPSLSACLRGLETNTTDHLVVEEGA